MSRIWHEMDEQLANHVRGKGVEILIVGAVSIVAFALFGLGYALLLGFLAGLSVVIPCVGAVVVAVPVAIILAVLVFGSVWGVWGAFFAIPLATLVKAMMSAWPRSHAGAPAPQTPG